jgi:FixJ family two-component response regulator
MFLRMVAHRPHIIIVDDDPSMGQAIARLLVAAGWGVRIFQSAEAVINHEALLNAGCMVLDIELPGMSGIDLHARLAEAGIHLPVIFITGHDRPIFREKAESAGACYLSKPFPSSQLIEKVRRHIEAA